MELRHLRTFTAVATRLSFSAAARALHTSQSAVSETVRDLEAELGVELLARNRHTVKLTAAGTALLRDGSRLLEQASAAALAAQHAARGEAGRLAIGFPAPATAAFLPALVREFRRRHPGVDVILHEMTACELLQGMVERRIDLGFTQPLEVKSALPMHEEALFTDGLCVALPRSHVLARETTPLPLRALTKEGIVLTSRTKAQWLHTNIVEACRRARFAPRVVAAPDSMTTAIMLVEAEVGVAIVPCSTAHYHRQSPVVFRPLDTGGMRIPLLAVWPRDSDSPTVRLFCELMRERRPQILEAVVLRATRTPPRRLPTLAVA